MNKFEKILNGIRNLTPAFIFKHESKNCIPLIIEAYQFRKADKYVVVAPEDFAFDEKKQNQINKDRIIIATSKEEVAKIVSEEIIKHLTN